MILADALKFVLAMQPRPRSDNVALPLSPPTVNDFTDSELEELSAVTVYVPATVMHTSADVDGTEPVLHFVGSVFVRVLRRSLHWV